MTHLILGTRGSKLALAQSETCAETLRAAGIPVEVRVIKTTSDHRPDEPLSVIDERDVFTRQLDEALISGGIDFAVHSLKDIPTEVPKGMRIAAVPSRHDPSDALVSDEGYEVDDLPDGAMVATSSLRRRAQLLHHRPDLRIVDIRGNVGTRIRKVREGEADALVLAKAGLDRLELDMSRTVIPHAVLLPAVGQGALGITMMEDHPRYEEVRSLLNDRNTENSVLAERAMMRELEGGCRVPVGAWSAAEDGEIKLKGLVASEDGALVYRAEGEGSDPEEVGRRVARDLIGQGASIVLDEIQEART
ncbi:MAG: hydroxymethylbilane synthase [Rubrobacter sp.]|jgi:hydroxymethylbilane synthase|nr:hydroxymethylbilane synthase [Rubrobacter sp.]